MSPPLRADVSGQLLEKYTALAAKYGELTGKYERLRRVRRRGHRGLERAAAAGERAREQRASLCERALALSSAGVAAVRAGRLEVLNGRWRELEAGGRDAAWTAIGGAATEAAPRALRDVAIDGARALGARRARVERYRSGDGARLVQLRWEPLAEDPSPPPGGDSAASVHVLVFAEDVQDLVDLGAVERAAHEAAGHVGRVHERFEAAARTAHDLRNGLQVLVMHVRLLGAGPPLAAAQARDLGVVERLVDDAVGLAGRLHAEAVAGWRDGGAATGAAHAPASARAAGSVELDRVVERAVEAFRPGERGDPPVAVQVELRGVPAVVGDAAELQALLLNLLINARDAMPRGGTIRIHAGERPGGVVLLVDDTGMGIPPALLPRLLAPFSTSKDDGRGGLGLSNAARVMRRIGGSIEIANRAEGGARIALSFRRDAGG